MRLLEKWPIPFSFTNAMCIKSLITAKKEEVNGQAQEDIT